MDEHPQTDAALRQLLACSAFYPNSDLDGKCMEMLSTRISTFIYASWSVTKKQLEDDVHQLVGYRVESLEEMPLDRLVPADWQSARMQERFSAMWSGDPATERPRRPFTVNWCIHIVWKRLERFGPEHGLPRLQLYFFNGDAMLVFEGLYTRLGVNPAALAVIQPGGGEGGTQVWTMLEEPGGFFHQLVRETSVELPRVLLLGGHGDRRGQIEPCWPEYVPTGREVAKSPVRHPSLRAYFIKSTAAEFVLAAHAA